MHGATSGSLAGGPLLRWGATCLAACLRHSVAELKCLLLNVIFSIYTYLMFFYTKSIATFVLKIVFFRFFGTYQKYLEELMTREPHDCMIKINAK